MKCDKIDLWKSQGYYVINHRKAYPYALIVLVILVILNYLVGGKLLTANDSWWNSFLNPIVGLGTLFTAIAVWLGETTQDWRDSLPKKLTVKFFHKGSEVMRCEKAYLSGEGDIRALGQQIGLQMAGEQLKFKVAKVQTEGEKVEKDKKGYFLHYEAIFELTDLPNKLQHLGTKYLLWHDPFDSVEPIERILEKSNPNATTD